MTEAGARDQGSDAFTARDQPESAFAHILSSFVMSIPGARGAALVDSEGETVDYTGHMEPFALRVAAAHWRIVFNQASVREPVGRIALVAVRAERASYLVHGLNEGHALVVVLASAVFDLIGWRRRLHACASALADEAGWSGRGGRDRDCTFPIVIVSDGEERPAAVRVAGVSRPLEIIGTVVGGPDRGEVAWRVRFDTGLEATLARESGGGWHADVPLGALSTDVRCLGASIEGVQGGLAQGAKRVQHKGR